MDNQKNKPFLYLIQAGTDVLMLESCLDAILVALSFEQVVSVIVFDEGECHSILTQNKLLKEKFLMLKEFGLRSVNYLNEGKQKNTEFLGLPAKALTKSEISEALDLSQCTFSF